MSGGRTKTKAHRSTCPVWGLWGCSVHGWGSMPRRYRRVHLVFSPAGMLISPLAGKRELLLGSSLHLKPRSLLAPKGGSRSPLSASPPESRRLSPRRGDGRSVWLQHLVQHGGAVPPGFPPLLLPFALQPAPAKQAVPTMAPGSCPDLGPGSQGWKDPKEGSPCPEHLQVCCPETPPTPLQEQHPCEAEAQKSSPSLATSVFACLPGSVLKTVTSLLGGGRGSQSPLRRAGSEEKRCPLPCSQAPRPPPAVRLYYIFTTNPVPMVASSCKHFRPVTFI